MPERKEADMGLYGKTLKGYICFGRGSLCMKIRKICFQVNASCNLLTAMRRINFWNKLQVLFEEQRSFFIMFATINKL